MNQLIRGRVCETVLLLDKDGAVAFEKGGVALETGVVIGTHWNGAPSMRARGESQWRTVRGTWNTPEGGAGLVMGELTQKRKHTHI